MPVINFREMTMDSIIEGLETAAVLVESTGLTSEEYIRIQRHLDQLQCNMNANSDTNSTKAICYHLEEAETYCRGRRMAEEEWQKIRTKWVEVGIALAPCRSVTSPAISTDVHDDIDAFDSAMEILKD